MPIGPMIPRRARSGFTLVLVAAGSSFALASIGDRPHLLPWDAVRNEAPVLVQITSNRIVGLYPGARRELILTFHNTKRKRMVVRNVRVLPDATDRRGCAPSRRNLRVGRYSGPPIGLPPRGRRSIKLFVRMPYSVADACQRAVFKVRYTADTFAGGS